MPYLHAQAADPVLQRFLERGDRLLRQLSEPRTHRLEVVLERGGASSVAAPVASTTV